MRMVGRKEVVFSEPSLLASDCTDCVHPRKLEGQREREREREKEREGVQQKLSILQILTLQCQLRHIPMIWKVNTIACTCYKEKNADREADHVDCLLNPGKR